MQDRELANRQEPCVIGEVAIDSTSDPWTAGVIFGFVPTMYFTLAELGALPQFISTEQKVGQFHHTGTALRD